MRGWIVVAALGAAACASSTAGTAERPTQVTDTGDGMHVSASVEQRLFTHGIQAPIERTWGVLPAVFQELGLGGTSDATRRTASSQLTFTRRVMGEPATRFFDCGRGQFGMEIASTYTIFVTVQVTVNPGLDETGSRLDSTVEAYARNTDGANALLAQCRSQGRLEELIAARVRERVAG